jgi:arylsulfatase A
MNSRDRYKFVMLTCVALASLCLISAGASTAAEPSTSAKPNIVVILISDLGWSDLGCYGSTVYETKNIDKLAKEGMLFSNAYAASCQGSPSRAAIMTGKYPARLHFTNEIPANEPIGTPLVAPKWTRYLKPEEMTIAKALKAAGYATGSIGKWNFYQEKPFAFFMDSTQKTPETAGKDEADDGQEKKAEDNEAAYTFNPLGFDKVFGGDFRDQTYSFYWPFQIPDIKGGDTGDFLTDRLTDEAEKFMESNRSKPFFLMLSHYAAHPPTQAKQELVEKYRRKIEAMKEKRAAAEESELPQLTDQISKLAQDDSDYAGVIEGLDENVGRLMDKIKSLGIADRTIIILTSDSGGLLSTTSNLPLQGGKGTSWEGGVRVPLIVSWPGAIKEESWSAAPVMGMDFYPTLLSVAGLDSDAKFTSDIDGESLLPLLKQTGSLKREAIFWHFPHYNDVETYANPDEDKPDESPFGPYSAVRKGDFKYVQYIDGSRAALYNLKEDIGEKENLYGNEALREKAAELDGLLTEWQKKIGAQMPEKNPLTSGPLMDSVPLRGGKGKSSFRPRG